MAIFSVPASDDVRDIVAAVLATAMPPQRFTDPIALGGPLHERSCRA